VNVLITIDDISLEFGFMQSNIILPLISWINRGGDSASFGTVVWTVPFTFRWSSFSETK